MAWSTIRKATDEDIERLNTAGTRFVEKHGRTWDKGFLVSEEPRSVAQDLADDNDHPDHPYLRKLWRAAVRRALRCRYADGIAYGYVGSHVE